MNRSGEVDVVSPFRFTHVGLLFFFRTKAREEPGFELTKPSTGQELQQTTKLQRSEGYNGNTGLKR